MATDIVAVEKDHVASVPNKPETVPLEKALDQVRRDSREKAEEFLDETVVPHGGE
jgi:hypothetical protein